ncbi:WXG100 family type VII secretion target [Cellulomonas sp. URHD0024]|uniref:WXG100 family type VII secretion target n=1 Tax=Cellulomonas sp. URHD0024 TaxID=1302620 RepID=UPI0003F9C6B6|nr:WXG100 family type VII secretion target [Cellulomonas sp. URHD0024]
MTGLTLDVVRSWRPQALAEASTGVESARREVEGQVQAAKDSVARLTSVWEGQAADAAAERMAREATTGFALVAALDAARAALSAGAVDLGTARDVVLSRVTEAQAAGFTVTPEGRVTARTLPPVLTAVGDPTGAGARREAQQKALNSEAAHRADAITEAVTALVAVDQAVAGRLGGVEVPQTLRSSVDAYLQRALASHDVVGSLGLVGAGGYAFAQVIKKGVGEGLKTAAYAKFLTSEFAPITDIATMTKNFDRADAMLSQLKFGNPEGLLGKIIGARAAGLVGKVFLPLTIVSAGVDVVTGGGYDGARGWATRGFAVAGGVGAGLLLFATLTPVGAAVAGAAVLAYGAWTLGNYVWDNREAIGSFFSSVGGHIADGASAAWNATSDAVSSATDWAHDRLSDAASSVGDTLSNVGKGALKVASFGFL